VEAARDRSITCDHLVQIYRDASELAESVAIFIGAGLDAGEPAVVVATAEHWPRIADCLGARGFDVDGLEAEERLVRADAETTLEAISEDGRPTTPRFAAVVGDLLDRASSAVPTRRVRVFGEMVDILCRRGDAEGADALEALWNRLATERRFTLLCGYKIDVFDQEAQVNLLPQIYRAHSHVVEHDGAAMNAAVEAALTDVLGAADAQKVYARVEGRKHDEHVPLAQRALMWLSAQMPRTAEQVLAAARAEYDTASSVAA